MAATCHRSGTVRGAVVHQCGGMRVRRGRGGAGKPGFRHLRGTAAYVAAVYQSLMRFRAARMRVTVDGEARELRGMLCCIANSQSYGGGMRVAPEARIDDGLFDLCLLADATKWEFLCAFPRVFRGTHTTHPKVTMLRGRVIEVESDPPLPVLIDGEVTGRLRRDSSWFRKRSR